MSTAQVFLAGYLTGALSSGLAGFWLARAKRAKSDHRGTKASLPALWAAFLAALKKLAAVSLVGLTVLAVAVYAAARSM